MDLRPAEEARRLRQRTGRCAGLNVTGRHKLTGNGTTRRCGFVGARVLLLEEVCQRGGGLGGLRYAQATNTVTAHFLYSLRFRLGSPILLPSRHHVPP